MYEFGKDDMKKKGWIIKLTWSIYVQKVEGSFILMVSHGQPANKTPYGRCGDARL